MKENNNNNEKKYDINQDYILKMLIDELIYVLIFCFFWFNEGNIGSLIGFILCTILNLSSSYPYIVRQLKDKKDNNDIK